MFLHEKEITVPLVENHKELLNYFSRVVLKSLPANEMPVRFVVTRTDEKGYHCELGVLSDTDNYQVPPRDSIFEFRKRDFENTEQFNAVLLVPTGIGAEIGGHSGDAGPIAKI